MTIQIGSVVRSRAGRDAGKWLVVIGQRDDKWVVADGSGRKVAGAKAKKAMHLQPTRDVLQLPEVVEDHHLRKLLAGYQIKTTQGDMNAQR